MNTEDLIKTARIAATDPQINIAAQMLFLMLADKLEELDKLNYE